VLPVTEGPACGDRCVEHKGHQCFRPISRAESNSCAVMDGALRRLACILATPSAISDRRRSVSGTSRAIGLPCRVMMSVAPRSTSSSNSGRCVFASEACIWRILFRLVDLTSRFYDSRLVAEPYENKRPGFGRGVVVDMWEGLGALDFFETGGFATESA